MKKFIDCCAVNPEDMLEQKYVDGRVSVHSKNEDETVKMTADLIENCFEKRNTGIREAACDHRIKKLAVCMNILYKTLQSYKKNPNSERYQKSLKAMLNRKSKFAAFKRNYVKYHIVDYPELEKFLK